MIKVFLSATFSDAVDSITGQVIPEFREFIEKVLKSIRDNEMEVFAAVEDEGWMLANSSPPEIAVAKGKRVILARHESAKLAIFDQGVVSSGLVTLVSYVEVDTLIDQFVAAVNAPVD